MHQEVILKDCRIFSALGWLARCRSSFSASNFGHARESASFASGNSLPTVETIYLPRDIKDGKLTIVI